MSQKGGIAPLLIIIVVLAVIAATALYFMGIIKLPFLASNSPRELQTPPPVSIQDSSSSANEASPAAGEDYTNPFTQDDPYENPFNSL